MPQFVSEEHKCFYTGGQSSAHFMLQSHCPRWHCCFVHKLQATLISIGNQFLATRSDLYSCHKKSTSWALLTVARIKLLISIHPLTSSKFGIFELWVAEDEVLKPISGAGDARCSGTALPSQTRRAGCWCEGGEEGNLMKQLWVFRLRKSGKATVLSLRPPSGSVTEKKEELVAKRETELSRLPTPFAGVIHPILDPDPWFRHITHCLFSHSFTLHHFLPSGIAEHINM